MIRPEELPRALVVDDDAATRDLVSYVLEGEKFRVDRASGGREAIDMLKNNNYAMVLLDLIMPKTDGFDVLEELHKHQPETIRNVIVMTAVSDITLKRIEHEAVCGIIRKPFKLPEFRSYIAECSRNIRNLREYLDQPS